MCHLQGTKIDLLVNSKVVASGMDQIVAPAEYRREMLLSVSYEYSKHIGHTAAWDVRQDIPANNRSMSYLQGSDKSRKITHLVGSSPKNGGLKAGL